MSQPDVPPYLQASAEALRQWRANIDQRAPRQTSRLRVGISCSGNPKLTNDRNRSVPLRQFAALFGESQSAGNLAHDFFFVQKECREADAAFLQTHPGIHDLRSELHDFVDTAAALAQMDLLISVDTSVAHLAGALNYPVWILLPFAPDWRWQLSRSDSPWYPSAKLWRQQHIGNWDEVFTTLAQELAARR